MIPDRCKPAADARAVKKESQREKKLQKPAAVCNFINGAYSLLFAVWVGGGWHTGAVF
jgi:hypothetical protein